MRTAIRAAALAAAGILIASTAVWTTASASAQQPRPNTVTVKVLDVTPSTPAATATKQALTVRLSLTNTTGDALAGLTIEGARGNPISSQRALDAAIAHPQPPDENLAGNFDTASGQPLTTSLAAHGSRTIAYTSSSDTAAGDAGLCICQNRIYPLYLTVHAIDSDGNNITVGAAQTYVPSFGDATKPQPMQVSWLWPLLDRPHRLTSNTTFTDDDLNAEVSTGGRLSKLLAVVEGVVAQVPTFPMTLVVDPDLIDELAVMSSATGYTVAVPGLPTAAGTGGPAAATWLERLRTVLVEDPNIELDFTPFADPDVESLTRAGLGWTAGLSPNTQKAVTDALGGVVPTSDITWPVDETLSLDTLTSLVRQGTQTVVVDDSTLRGGASAAPPPNALATIQTSAGSATAAVTSAPIEKYVAQVLPAGGPGLAALPQLVAEVAIRAVEAPSQSHYVVITPPRNLDPDPAVATRAILETAATAWATPLLLRSATQTLTPVDHGRLTPHDVNGLPAATLTSAAYVTSSLPGLTSMFTNEQDRQRVIEPLPTAVQRTESSAWRSAPALSAQQAGQLKNRVNALVTNVFLVRPSNGTYTLTSSTSPLPVTITNNLAYSVAVEIAVHTLRDLSGFSAKNLEVKLVPAHSTVQIRIPTHVTLTGRIQVQATLSTPPDGTQPGLPLGRAITLSVHSTALGTIGVIITVVAGVVLVLALLFRLFRRWRGRGRGGPAKGALTPAATE